MADEVKELIMDPFTFLILLFGFIGTVGLVGAIALGLIAKNRWEKLSYNMRGGAIIVLGLLMVLAGISYGAVAGFFWIWRYMI